MYSIADLHCDLLMFLAEKVERTPFDPKSRCAIPQLKEGNVSFQTLAIYAETNAASADFGWKQTEAYANLLKNYSQYFQPWTTSFKPELKSEKISVLYAIENASCFCTDQESLGNGFERLQKMLEFVGKPLYITMTWNTENRFGGGAHTKIGLKDDGKELLNWMHQKKIAIDFSHTSDALAYDILNYTVKHALDIPIIASHSNFRAISNWERNLPDDIALEILRREGIIGLNFVRSFVGIHDPVNFAKQLEHGLKLGASKQLCFGADFFYEEDLPETYRKKAHEHFFPKFGNSSTYPDVIEIWKRELKVNDELIEDIAHRNLLDFMKKKIVSSD